MDEDAAPDSRSFASLQVGLVATQAFQNYADGVLTCSAADSNPGDVRPPWHRFLEGFAADVSVIDHAYTVANHTCVPPSGHGTPRIVAGAAVIMECRVAAAAHHPGTGCHEVVAGQWSRCRCCRQVDHEIMMVGCTTYTAPGGSTATPVYIVKNQWGTGPSGVTRLPCPFISTVTAPVRHLCDWARSCQQCCLRRRRVLRLLWKDRSGVSVRLTWPRSPQRLLVFTTDVTDDAAQGGACTSTQHSRASDSTASR